MNGKVVGRYRATKWCCNGARAPFPMLGMRARSVGMATLVVLLTCSGSFNAESLGMVVLVVAFAGRRSLERRRGAVVRVHAVVAIVHPILSRVLGNMFWAPK